MLYSDLIFIIRLELFFPDFDLLTEEDKIMYIMSDDIIRYTAKFICDAFSYRQRTVYVDVI